MPRVRVYGPFNGLYDIFLDDSFHGQCPAPLSRDDLQELLNAVVRKIAVPFEAGLL